MEGIDAQERQEGLAKLDALKVDAITKEVCEAWQTRFSNHYAEWFSTTPCTAGQCWNWQGPQEANQFYKVGAHDLLRTNGVAKSEQFDSIVTMVETSGAAQARDCADHPVLELHRLPHKRGEEGDLGDVDWQAGMCRFTP